MIKGFEEIVKQWASSACEYWNYPEPEEDYFNKINNRLPEGLQQLLLSGLANRIVTQDGYSFSIECLKEGKGPYHWFGRDDNTQKPCPHWEYFVQVAEFIRLYYISKRNGLNINFEDDLMDISLYKGDSLLLYCEVKEKISQLHKLIQGIRKCQDSVNLGAPDRGNDPLRKAKYIVRRHPPYFSGVAIGVRYEYRVSYLGENSFSLVRDDFPFV